MTGESVFFREWRARRPQEERSIARAGELAAELGLTESSIPVLTIVGSKGKGTAATYASAYLAAAGLRVVTVTSPSYRSDTERIRVRGRAISSHDLADLADLLDRHMRRLPSSGAHNGYLSPVGLFTLAGLAHAKRIGADAVVLEAGRGGRSDEVSLFAPKVVGLTQIFAEHLGQIGPYLDAIVVDKADSITELTRTVVSLPQTPAVWSTLNDALGMRKRQSPFLEVVPPLSSGIPSMLLAPGINRSNSELGIVAAQALLDVTTHGRPEGSVLRPVLESVQLPGRMSLHAVPGHDTEVLADSAINQAGIAMALSMARTRWHDIDHVLLCLPDHKDLVGAAVELADLPVTFVRLPDPHLRFERRLPATWQTIDAEELSTDALAGLGHTVLAVGTVYFVGRILEIVNADLNSLFVSGDALRG